MRGGEMNVGQASKVGQAPHEQSLVKISLGGAEDFAARVREFGEESPRLLGLLDYGISPWSGVFKAPEQIEHIEHWKATVAPKENAVWMDNTTITTAAALVYDEERYLTPLTLWDLGAFARCVVSYNR